MENFLVSARKYRPDRFDKVVGQQNITNTLKNAIKNNHLAQAFLFSGPRGVGKTTIARLMAKTLNCTNITEDIEPCNECESCQSFNESSSFNVHELDAASNNSVEDIRSLVDQVRIPPQAGNYKVYIIDEVHMLSTSAFNAFLKTLEEPPSYAKFILATTEKHKIIPTILSRCQSYDFQRIPVDHIKAHLTNVAESEQIQAEPEALHMIAQKADGALRDALSIFDQVVNFAGETLTYQHVLENLNILDYDYYFKMSHYFLDGNIQESLLLYEDIIIKGFEGQQFLSGLGTHFRNLLVCRDESTIKLLEVGAEIKKKYLEHASRFSTDMLLQMIEILNKADLNYKNANNKRLQVELALMQICSIASPQKKTEVSTAEEQEPIIQPPDNKNNAESTSATRSNDETESHTQEKVSSGSSKNAYTNNKSEEQEKTTEVKLKKRRKGLTGISLKEDYDDQAKEEEPRADQPKGPVKPIYPDELKQALEEFAGVEPNSSFVNDVKRFKPEIYEDTKVEFILTNKIYENSKHILNLQDFLRKKLDNPYLTISTRVELSNIENDVYTSDEKYKRMKELNSDFEDFKQKLDLDYQ